jgi:hypothetical protein
MAIIPGQCASLCLLNSSLFHFLAWCATTASQIRVGQAQPRCAVEDAMTAKIQFGLFALIALSALAAVYVSVLIARRQDLPSAARRAFLLSNVSLIFCLAATIAGISFYSRAHFWGKALLILAAIFLILKFVFVRRFAHLIRRGQTASQHSVVTGPVGRRT